MTEMAVATFFGVQPIETLDVYGADEQNLESGESCEHCSVGSYVPSLPL
jgi:CII-binding regulator of phage lambda lysogenization HflD